MQNLPDILKKHEPFWGGWYIEDIIGSGSFGKVYKIKKEDFLGKEYFAALKWVQIPHDSNEIRERYLRGYTEESIKSEFDTTAANLIKEIELMKKLGTHSNIVGCEDFEVVPNENEIGWNIFIKMELLTPLLEHFLQPKTVGDVIQMAIDLCDGLTRCEQERIIHRDIKPANIFVADSGIYKLGDFGVSKQLEQSMADVSRQGTPMYMAPEIYKGEQRAGHSIDLYSLGLVMHELLNNMQLPYLPTATTGAIPTSAMKQEVLYKRLNGTPITKPAHGGEALAKVILKACEYNPKKRYQTAQDMKVALVEAEMKTNLAEPLQNKRENAPHTAPVQKSDVQRKAQQKQNTPNPSVQEDLTVSTGKNIRPIKARNIFQNIPSIRESVKEAVKPLQQALKSSDAQSERQAAGNRKAAIFRQKKTRASDYWVQSGYVDEQLDASAKKRVFLKKYNTVKWLLASLAAVLLIFIGFQVFRQKSTDTQDLLARSSETSSEALPLIPAQEDLTYIANKDGSITLTEYTKPIEQNTSFKIPKEINGLKVTKVDLPLSNVKKLIIPESLREISSKVIITLNYDAEIEIEGNNPFLYYQSGMLYSSLERAIIFVPNSLSADQLVIADNVSKIADYAFFRADNVKSVVIPASVMQIAPFGMGDYSSRQYQIAEANARYEYINGCLYDKESKSLLMLLDGTLKDIRVKEGTKDIRESAFAYSNITSIAIPKSVSIIESNVFAGASVVSIQVETGSYAEQYCISNKLNYGNYVP